jgi:hypothetical protein
VLGSSVDCTNTFTYSGPMLWNELPFCILQASSHNAFKAKVKSLILNDHVPYITIKCLLNLLCMLITCMRPKLKYCLFAVSRPTQKNLRDSKDFIAVFKIKKIVFPKFSFRSVPCFSKVPVSSIFGILVVFP